MTSIPLFESLQNEMHQRMGCSHLGCFNEGNAAKASVKKAGPPSSWSGGFYGFLCEGKRPIDEPVIRTAARLIKGLRRGAAMKAQEKGEALANTDDIRAATMYGGNIEEARAFGNDIARYPSASDRERRALEREASLAFHMDNENASRLLDVLARIKSGEFGDPTGRGTLASGLISKIGRSLRTGANGFYQEGVEGNSFPEELWRDPAGFAWDDPNSFKSRNQDDDDFVSDSWGTYADLGENKREAY